MMINGGGFSPISFGGPFPGAGLELLERPAVDFDGPEDTFRSAPEMSAWSLPGDGLRSAESYLDANDGVLVSDLFTGSDNANFSRDFNIDVNYRVSPESADVYLGGGGDVGIIAGGFGFDGGGSGGAGLSVE